MKRNCLKDLCNYKSQVQTVVNLELGIQCPQGMLISPFKSTFLCVLDSFSLQVSLLYMAGDIATNSSQASHVIYTCQQSLLNLCSEFQLEYL